MKMIPLNIQKLNVDLKTMSAGLVLTIESKNCSAMARTLNYKHDSLTRIQEFIGDNYEEVRAKLLQRVKIAQKESPGFLIVDGLTLPKPHSFKNKMVNQQYCGSTRTTGKAIGLVAAAWTNGDKTLPFDFELWGNKEVEERIFQKQPELMLNLIQRSAWQIGCTRILADGFFATQEVMQTLIDNGLGFIMRMKSNRVVTDVNGNTASLRDLPSSKLTKNNRVKVTKILWKNMWLYVIAARRKNRNGLWEKDIFSKQYQNECA